MSKLSSVTFTVPMGDLSVLEGRRVEVVRIWVVLRLTGRHASGPAGRQTLTGSSNARTGSWGNGSLVAVPDSMVRAAAGAGCEAR